MSVYQIASGSCTGRGFADVDSSGWLANFKSWVVKDATSGGPNWNMLLDRSPLPTPVTYSVNSTGTTHTLDSTSHGFITGEIVQLTNTGGSLPSGLNLSQDYFVYKLNTNQFRLCYYLTDTWTGTGVNIGSYGSGTQYATLEGPYIVVSDQSSLTINQSAMIMKAGYRVLESGKLRVQYGLSFDTTNGILYGYWGGFFINTVDAGPFSYDFRGGAECMIVQSRIGSSWSTALVDSWLGDSNFVEGTDKKGSLTVPATAGTNVTLYLNAGEELNFTPNRYYYIYDMNGHAWINYCKVTADDTVAHTITVSAIDQNFPTGSVIAAYTHRMYCAGSVLTDAPRFNEPYGGANSSIPYCSNYQYSNRASAAAGNQNNPIWGSVKGSADSATLVVAAPNDRNYYACQKPFIVERYNFQTGSTYDDGMSEGYGIMKNMYVTARGSMVQGLDGRTIGGNNWLFFQTFSNLVSGGDGNLGAMFLDSTSLV